jgi:hypothetical protein
MIRNIIKIWKFGGLFNWLLFRQSVKDPAFHRAVARLNRAVDRSEKSLQKGYGKQYKLHRYRLIDWFIPAEW